jgi:hypothetical protein
MFIENKNQNIIVCFPAGAGGHLIGTLCSVLLGKSGRLPDANGSMHSSVIEGIIHINSSLPQDIIIQEKFPVADIIIGHFTNVKLLSQIGKKVIYITFTTDDLDEIIYRANKKTKIDLKDKNTYTLLAGTSWPSYEEFCAGADIPMEEKNWSVNKKHYSYWKYNLPNDKNNTLEIKFHDINHSELLLDEIANFMNIKMYDKNKLLSILNAYRSINNKII